MIHSQVTCDGCEADITSTYNDGDTRLVLAAEYMQLSGNTSTAISPRREIYRPHHFCGLRCMRDWVTAKIGGAR